MVGLGNNLKFIFSKISTSLIPTAQLLYPLVIADIIVSLPALSIVVDGFLKKLIIWILSSSQLFGKEKLKHSVIVSPLEIEEGKTEVTVLLDDEETTFTMSNTDNILAASLRHNLDAPYSCQGGVCSSCLCKVTEGKAVMTKNSILTDSEVEEGFVLACQAHPTTSKITIDFDDV